MASHQLDVPVAPRESPEHLALHEVLEQGGQDVELLRDILWLITAHDRLTAFSVVVDRLHQILTAVRDPWLELSEEFGLPDWLPLLTWLQGNAAQIGDTIGKAYLRATNSTGHNPLWGQGATRFPLYFVLCEILPEAPHEIPFLTLSGYLLIAQVRALIERPTSRDEYEASNESNGWQPLRNSIYPATLAVRRLAVKKNRSHLEVLQLNLPPEEFAIDLEKLPSSADKGIQDDREKLFRMLQRCFGLRPWRGYEAQGGGGGGHGWHRWVGNQYDQGFGVLLQKLEEDDPRDVEGNWGSMDMVMRVPATEKARNLLLDSDETPEESGGDDEIFLSHVDCKDGKKDLGALARVARAKTRHIRISNQILPWGYESLALEELAHLLEAISEGWFALPKPLIPGTDAHVRAELLVLIHVMLWTGSDAQRAAETRVFFDGEADSRWRGLGVVIPTIRPIRKICWRIPAATPTYATPMIDNGQHTRKLASAFDLPDIVGLGSMIGALINHRERISNGSRIFVNASDVLAQGLSRWLDASSTDTRLTPQKISGFLSRQLIADTGDTTMMTVITGVPHRLSGVRLFYTTLDIRHLQERYQRTVERVMDQAYRAIGKEPRKAAPWLAPAMESLSVGGRLCPLPGAVRTMFESLREAVGAAAGYVDRCGFARYHNLYTLLTLQCFAYATSCRAIITPYVRLSEVDRERGITSLSDKDDEFNHKTRLVWIPPPVLEQMDCHERHRNILLPQLAWERRQIVREPCFFLDDECRALAAQPVVIETWLKDFLPVKANTHRRFLRTELLERGCPPEVIDAFMGHWQQGEEPFSLGQALATRRIWRSCRNTSCPC
jgi:hypothetical protein